jgi:hypothetical protein
MAGTLRIDQRRGAQITLPTHRAVAPHQVAERQTPMPRFQLAVLVLALPMFAQCFQYMVDVLPLYALSKAWPILMLPLFVWGLMRLDLPYKLLQVATLVWVLGVTPLIGIAHLGNEAGAALTTTVKVWPFASAFSLAAMLVLLKTPDIVLRRTLLSLGFATYAIMLLLWIVVPARAYGGGDAVTKLFMYDPERGQHIYMSMFFGMLLIFYLNRSFWIRPRVWIVAALLLAFVLQLWIDKERAAIGGAAVTVVIGAALSMRRFRVAACTGLMLIGGIGIIYAAIKLQSNVDLHSSLGGSLSVRTVSVATAWNYISADPLRWLFGIGATTRFGDITLAQLFGNRMFFLTDIGWLGVAFEYGLIGTLLMLLAHVGGLRAAVRWSTPGDALALAMVDYIIYLMIVSAVYSVVFTPGELTTVIGLSYYLSLAKRRRSHTRQGALSHLANPMPRHIALARPKPSGRFALAAPSGLASKG